ncbi:sulfotransferase family protein [Blastococcus sp. SYSU D00695]
MIAPPRSGSTLLFECLARFGELTAFTHREGTFIWRRVLPYDQRATVSDRIDPAEFSGRRRLEVKALLYAYSALTSPVAARRDRLVRLLRRPRMRYLDKTVSNAFRLDLLAEMFPDASFVFLVRDPRTNLASMITSWPEERFAKPPLTRYVRASGSALPHWTYAAPPGWRSTLGWSLPEICAWSWQQHAEAILAFRRSGAGGPLVRYEELVRDPVSVVGGLARHLGLEMTPDIAEHLARPPRSRTTSTIPSDGARRALVAAQVESVLPRVAETARAFGY